MNIILAQFPFIYLYVYTMHNYTQILYIFYIYSNIELCNIILVKMYTAVDMCYSLEYHWYYIQCLYIMLLFIVVWMFVKHIKQVNKCMYIIWYVLLLQWQLLIKSLIVYFPSYIISHQNIPSDIYYYRFHISTIYTSI